MVQYALYFKLMGILETVRRYLKNVPTIFLTIPQCGGKKAKRIGLDWAISASLHNPSRADFHGNRGT
jgi:hypothetical protein